MTIQNLGTKTEVLNFLPNDVVATTVTASTAIDLVDYEGDIAVVLCAEAGSSGVTYLGKLTEADTSGGSYTDVTGGAFTITTANTASVQKISVNSDNTKRFIKAVVTVAGGTGTGAVAIVGLGSKKYS
jgi:hypothetical protein